MKKFYPTLLLALLMLGSTSLLADPPGLMKKDKTPAGFSKGEKTGWQGDQPPGWDKSGRNSSADANVRANVRERAERDFDSMDTGNGKGKSKNKNKPKKKGKKK